MSSKAVYVEKGCNECESFKQVGLCKENKCIEGTTPKGQQIAKQAKISQTPQCVVFDPKKRKYVKCSTGPLLNKYQSKIKKKKSTVSTKNRNKKSKKSK